MSSRWWSTARSIRSLTRRGEIFFFKRMLSQETAATWYFSGFIGTPPWPLSVTYSILTKQCISFKPTHLYLNIPLDQTHPFLKGFYWSSASDRAQKKLLSGSINQDRGGGALECQGGYQAHPKIYVIRVVFQDQALYARTSFRGAKTCKIGKKGACCSYLHGQNCFDLYSHKLDQCCLTR